MENHSSFIRGLVNDLFRSLSAALIHVDELIMKLERNSDGFPDAFLTNEQLSRSIALFLELRSELDESVNITSSHYKHSLNELLTTVMGSCDLMLMDNNKDQIIDSIILIRNSIGNHMHLEEPIDNDNLRCTDNELKIISPNISLMNNDTCDKVMSNLEHKNKRILLVEDDNEVRKIISTALYREGYKVFESENAQSAKNIFYEENADFNLCLIDLGLPDMNGFQLAIELLNTNKKINMLFTSGQDKSMLYGHDDMIRKFNFLEKPYRIKKLINMVGNLLSSSL